MSATSQPLLMNPGTSRRLSAIRANSGSVSAVSDARSNDNAPTTITAMSAPAIAQFGRCEATKGFAKRTGFSSR